MCIVTILHIFVLQCILSYLFTITGCLECIVRILQIYFVLYLQGPTHLTQPDISGEALKYYIMFVLHV